MHIDIHSTADRGGAPANDERPAIRLAGGLLGPRRHICAFFNSQNDEYRVLLPFVKEGFDCGDKAVHIIDPRRRDEHLRRLASAGIDAHIAQETGQLDLRDWFDAHLRGGSFDMDRMLRLVDGIRETSRQQGFPRIRFITHMEWALEDRPGVDALLEYEAKANLVPSEDPVVCTYDLAKFSGDVIADVIRTHPRIIIGGVLHENPFFVPPEDFLCELRERRSGSRSARIVASGTPTDEIEILRGCIGDLVRVLALPAAWSGQDSSRVATTLLAALVSVLDLDLAYVRNGVPVEGSDTEWARQSESCEKELSPNDIGRALEPYWSEDPPAASLLIPNPVGEGVLSIALFRLGIRDPQSVLVAGSRRASFPTAPERLVLQVAANEAALGWEDARRAAQQRSAAQELECRVAERTEELTVANEALRKEVLERTRVDAQVRQDEQELRLLVDLMPQIVVTLGPDGTVLQMNRTALDYLGATSEEIIATQVQGTRICHPDDLAAMDVAMKGVFSHGSTQELEARLRRHDGEHRWFRVRYEPLIDEQGRVLRVYVSGTDVDDRKRAEDRMREENVALREEIDKVAMFEEIVGTSAPLRGVLAYISKVAPASSTVLIAGETGTGKELVARALHRGSKRRARAFVGVNCAAIPPALVSSELFGHEKGAFTGALQRRIGRFELAEGGTIFLDEVGELPQETQIALLRVLQEREFERVGGSRPLKTDVRVVAATNRNLEEAVATGAFRADLFYRLNVIPVVMPSLRERREDIPLLVEYFVDRYSRNAGKRIKSVSKKSLALLQSYDWPGNIRELQNVIERSVILAEGDTLVVEEHWILGGAVRAVSARRPFASTRDDREKAMIEAALTETQGQVSGPMGAAARLQIPPSSLESRIRSLGIEKRRFRRVVRDGI